MVAQELASLLDSDRDLPAVALDAAGYVGGDEFDAVAVRAPVLSTASIVLVARRPNGLVLGLMAESLNFAPGQRSGVVRWSRTLTAYDAAQERSNVVAYGELRNEEVVGASMDVSDVWFVVELADDGEVESIVDDYKRLSRSGQQPA